MKKKKNNGIIEKSIDILNEEKINGQTIKGGGFRIKYYDISAVNIDRNESTGFYNGQG